MDPETKLQLAELWREILNTDPQQAFRERYKVLKYCESKHSDDLLPQPGYVGKNYEPGGVMFIGMNPGSPQNEVERAGDNEQLRIIESIRDCENDLCLENYEKLNHILYDIMRDWRPYKVYVEPILHGTGLSLHDISYINLLKWRTMEGKSLTSLYKISWSLHTREQISILTPKLIIALGKGVYDTLGKILDLPAEAMKIQRRRGCQIGPEGMADQRACIDQIMALGLEKFS